MKKRMVIIVGLILMTRASCFAAGFSFINNPDRYPSLGLSFGMVDIDGVNDRVLNANTALPNTNSLSTSQKTQDVTIDLRLPVSHELTLFGAFSVISQALTSNDGNLVFSNDSTLDGFGFRVGARYYFNP